jgi:hypothetical protein
MEKRREERRQPANERSGKRRERRELMVLVDKPIIEGVVGEGYPALLDRGDVIVGPRVNCPQTLLESVLPLEAVGSMGL